MLSILVRRVTPNYQLGAPFEGFSVGRQTGCGFGKGEGETGWCGWLRGWRDGIVLLMERSERLDGVIGIEG